MNKLKLYVWRGVLADYTDGVAFALAKSETHARQMVRRAFRKASAEHHLHELDARPAVYTAPRGFAKWGGA